MRLPFKWRRVSNIFGIFFTSISFIGFVVSCVFLASTSWGTYLLCSSLALNYLITIGISWELINAQNREDLFINFSPLMFIIFPFLGVFLYFLLGFDSMYRDYGNRYKDIYLRYKKYENSCFQLDIQKQDPKFKTFDYNFIKNQAPVYRNAQISVLSNSYEILREIHLLISRATKFIHMEFYIFGNGLIFNHIFDLLRLKVKEGVEVRLIVDHIGNIWRLSKKSIRRLKKIGVQVRLFNPLFRSNNIWWQFRNHNKVIVVDNEYALIGSANISDEYFNITNKHFQTTELGSKLRGAIVSSVNALFLTHWDLSNKSFRSEFDEEKRKFYFSAPSSQELENNEFSEESFAQFLDNSPISGEYIIRDNLTQLIFSAQKRIVISTPYFFPPKEIVSALKLVRTVGVDVKILVPKNPDLINFFQTMNRQPFATLLKSGIKIYEYFGFNHEKLMIVDNEVVYFGSYNWDCRTFYWNFENALLVKGQKIAKDMHEFMEQQFKNSHEIYYDDLKKYQNSSMFTLFIRLFKLFL